ncbi:TetR/AcrR family transcriptional regulator [Roseibium sp. MB-4]
MEQHVKRRVFSPKERLILDAALELLIEMGDAGLTMRKLAERTEMRLSNVQYYFKTRDDVLIAMVAGYFEECTENLKKLAQQSNASTTRDRIRFLVQAVLVHGLEISDMCRAFREIWAISSRSGLIDECLMEYYRRFSKVVVDFAFEGKTDAASADRLTTLLIPYFEGYSITARALPVDMDDAADLLTDLAMSITVTGGD